MSIKTVALSPEEAPYPFYREGSPTQPPLIKLSSGIVNFTPGEDSWFWDSCWMGSPEIVEGFQATWPESLKPPEKTTADLVAKIAWDIFCILIFPLALVRLTLSLAYYISGFGVQPPASFLGRNEIACQESRKKVFGTTPFTYDPNPSYKSIFHSLAARHEKITTPDGVVLEGAFIQGSRPGKAILYVTGSGSGISACYTMLSFLAASGASVFMISPRGIEESGGSRNAKGMVLDVYTAYQFLIKEKGFDPNNILGYFFSLGGLHGNIGAALIQKEYPHAGIKVIDQCSPADLVTAAPAAITSVFGEGCLSSCAGTIAPPLLESLDWQMDGASAFKRLKGNRCIIFNTLDQTIPYPSSKYKKIKEEGHAFGTVHCLEMTTSEEERLKPKRPGGRNAREHLRFFNREEARWVVDQIDSLLELRMSQQAKQIMIERERRLNKYFG